jgi:nucleoprotein TPR
LERANTLAAELSAAITARDSAQQQARGAEAEAKRLAEEVASHQTTVEDLAYQVRELTRQIALRDNPSLAHSTAQPQEESGDMITDHFVAFASLDALLQRNRQLLTLTRSLASKLSDRETTRAEGEAATGLEIDQAAEIIEQQREQLEQTSAKLTEVTRERDLFSKLLSKGEGLHWPASGSNSIHDDSNEHAVASLQAELAAVRSRADTEVEEAKTRAREQSEKAGKAEVAQARADAAAEHLRGEKLSFRSPLTGPEQVRSISSTLDLQKTNYTNLESQLHQAQAQLSSSQLELRRARDDVASHQAAEKRLRDEAAQLRAEKELWESQQARLQSDFAAVQQERAKLTYTIENFTNVSTANERTRAEERTQLQKRVEELQTQA